MAQDGCPGACEQAHVSHGRAQREASRPETSSPKRKNEKAKKTIENRGKSMKTHGKLMENLDLQATSAMKSEANLTFSSRIDSQVEGHGAGQRA